MMGSESAASGWELFADGRALEAMQGDVRLTLHPPALSEVVLTCSEPWERALGFPSVTPDGKGGYFLYYRAGGYATTERWDDPGLVTCVCHSEDGARFERVDAGLYDFGGSTHNNIVYSGIVCANFTPFLDTNPGCKPDERFKALGGVHPTGLFALASADGLHWRPLSDQPVLTCGDFAFDSQNLAFYDPRVQKYRCYWRYWHRGTVRAIQSCLSEDFLRWDAPVPNAYGEEPSEDFYTSAACLCPGTEDLMLSFPNRYAPKRKRFLDHPKEGVSDTVFMASRDGVHWTRLFKEAWIRPGLDEKNWTARNMMVGSGLAQMPDGSHSLYCTEHNYAQDHRIRRVAIRRHGFVSCRAGWAGGRAYTCPFDYQGGRLELNYATSACGSVRAWLEDASAPALTDVPDAPALFGDSTAEIYPLPGAFEALAGRRVRLCFDLKDADVFAYRFV